jgi:hypothetical protein
MLTKRFHLIMILVLFMVPIAGASFADDADVLPKGVWRVKFKGLFYLPADQRFDQNGDKVDIARDYNTTLDAKVIGPLAQLDNIIGIPGFSNIGKSVVSMEYEAQSAELMISYGVTQRLTVGVILPYWWQRVDVSASLDNTNATVGFSPSLGNFAPLPQYGGPPDTTPLSTAQVQQLIQRVYGYKPIQSWSDQGFGDIEAGGRYQYYKSENWRLAFTGGIRFPTGKVDDPDNLVDQWFGKGVWALLFRLNNDYTGVNNLVLNATLGYDWNLPTHQELRVPDYPFQPLVPLSNKENVSLNMGDTITGEVSATYEFVKGFKASLLYSLAYKGKDNISGSKGLNYAALEEMTKQRDQIYIARLSYTTIPLYVEKKFPVPLTASIGYRNRIAGVNALATEYIEASVEFYF